MSELNKRIIVAILGIPLALFLIYIGGVVFQSVIIIITILSLFEFNKMFANKGLRSFKFFSLISSIIFQLIFLMDSIPNKHMFLILTIFLYVFISLLINLFSSKDNSILGLSHSFVGFFYITLGFTGLMGLANVIDLQKIYNNNLSTPEAITFLNNKLNSILILSTFLSIWMCDSAAYFIGTKFGKHRLFLRVSPKKSWEGAFAGFIFSILTFVLLTQSLMVNFSFTHSIVIGILIGIFGQIGDLVESQIKRDAGVKDSSNILPGHGGILDRFDSILFVSPIIYIYLLFILK